MPPGHTAADIADDFAGYVDERMGGRADLVVGVSFGGMVALLLATRPSRGGWPSSRPPPR